MVFIARKLGFASVQIQLEDDLRTWQIQPVQESAQHFFEHKLPGHNYCFIKLGIKFPKTASTSHTDVPKEFCMMSELVAEGWAKAVKSWQAQKNLPLRFDQEVSRPNPMETISSIKPLPVR